MKRRFTILTAAIALLAFFIPSFTAWATDVTFNYSDYKGNGTQSTGSEYTMVKTDVSITDSKFYCASNASYAQFYAGGVTTIAPKSGVTITKIELTATSTSYNGFQSSGTVDASTGSVSANGTTVTWTGSSAADFTISHSKQIRWTAIKVTYSTDGSSTTPTTVTIDATGITNTDVYTSTAAGSMSATVTANNTPVSGATVTWASSNTGVATIDADGVVTLVAAGTTTITASYAGNSTYDSSSNTYSLTVTDSTPFDGVIFDATQDIGTSPITKDNVSLACTSGVLDNGTEYRFYKNSTTTISITGGNKITKIEFTNASTNPATGFGDQTGWTTNSNGGIWEGEAESVSFVASGAQVRATMIKVTVLEITTPSISADDVNIAYDATSGEIAFTLNNHATNGSLSVSENVDWISNAVLNTTESKVTFTTTANEVTTAREGIITITYTYGSETVSKDVTVTQAAAPLVYTTIPALFNAATATATDVNVTFGDWVISAVKGSNAYLTDNQGNGLIIYASEHGFQVNDVLTGTASCKLQLYRGSAELTNLTTSTEGLTVTHSGTVTEQNIAISELSGVNTGALLAYQGLTYNGTALVDDNDNTITPYSTLYSYTFVNGKTYNVKGIYLQYNTTKELLPRSAADIEEVQVQHNEYTLTTSNLSHVDLYIFDAADQNTPIISGSGSAQVYDGTEVMISVDVETGYIIESLYVDGVDVTDQIDAADTYTFTMPTNNVTVTATAVEYVAPSGSNYVRISNLDQLTDGCKVVIAARHNSTVNSYYAMKNTANGKPVGTNFSSVTVNGNETLQSIIADDENDYYWTVNVTTDGYTFTNANDVLIGYNSGTNFAAGGNYTTWTIERSTSEATAMVGEYTGFVIKNFNTNARAFAFNGSAFGAYATSNLNGSGYNFFLDFFVQETSPVTETYTLDITGYGNNDGGYYLIASPVAEVTPSTENGFITDAFDLYWFDQTQEKEWKNYKVGQGFDLVNGMGYLYASQDNTTLTFVGTPYDGDGSVSLVKDDEAQFAGWNLVGNPFADSAYIDRDFYIMNPQTGKDLIQSNGVIAAMQGIFVSANEDGESLIFSTEPYRNNGKGLVMNVTGNRGNVIDRAVVRFGESRNLRKFQLFENSTRISISQDNSDYAVVCSDAQGEMPVNFKASENGTYTLSFNTENVEMDYLHLIDNMTGADIDLIANPSYSFEANTSDYTSRFRLVFAAGNNEMGNSFAFVSNGQIIVNGQGTVEVYDLTGRLISRNNDVTSIATDDMSAGVYMIRLTNGSSTKTQKIVVK